MTAPQALSDLISRFRDNHADYIAPTYKEFRLRKEFVDPFFELLGWDVSNTNGYAEAYKDVVHEDAIKVAGGNKAPDYAFRIGGARKFFVESKAPSVNIRDGAEPAFQLRRYGWSAKLPLCILTNFHDFAVYDCRTRPEKSDRSSVARMMIMSYEEFTTRWNEIADIFSREAILKGSFDRFAADASRRRGTTEVDDAFLSEIEHWRSELAKNIFKENPGLGVRELNAAVQRTIDRIVFLRIAEDRGIEPYGRLRELAKSTGIYERLGEVFRSADARYNSGLFHFIPGDGSAETVDTFTLKLRIHDKVLKPILQGLYYPDSPYEFSVLPADILGQVYEQFLGKVIRLKGAKAEIEEKPEVKKAGGVYYTPTHVVRYIVSNTIEPLLRRKTPAQLSGQDNRLKDKSPMRVLDPACGSGSFLIEAYQTLLDWYRDWYVTDGPEKHARGRDPKLYQVASLGWRLTIAEKRRILLTHIFGVDVDAQAVEVTKLSLLLKVLEGESADAIASQMDLFHIRALPDLGQNIKCGNSLIDSALFKDYAPTLFSLDERLDLNLFDWWKEFPGAGKVGGFDAIIGNPPYLYSAGQKLEAYFSSTFKHAEYQADFYVYFIERSVALLKKGGSLSFIVPDSWMNSDNFAKIRDLMINKSALKRVCSFRYFVFKKAAIENSVFILDKSSPAPEIQIDVSSKPSVYKARSRLQRTRVVQAGLLNPYFTDAAESVLERLDRHPPIGNRYDINRGIHAYRADGYGRSKFGKGPQTARDRDERSYHARSKLNDTYLPEIRGRDVHWLEYQTSGEFLSYGPWLAEPRDEKYFNGPRIMLRKTLGRVLSGAFIQEAAAIDQSLYIAVAASQRAEDVKHLLAILCSDVGAWYLRTKYAIYDLLHPWYTKRQLLTVPLPEIDPNLVVLVDEAIDTLARLHRSNTDGERRVLKDEAERIRSAMNRRVRELYQLNDGDWLTITEDLQIFGAEPET